jgi:hypothetical protein
MHILFTGPKCSGCVPVKTQVDLLGVGSSFEIVDVTERPCLANTHRVRSIPHIVSDTGEHFIGSLDCVKFVERVATSKKRT